MIMSIALFVTMPVFAQRADSSTVYKDVTGKVISREKFAELEKQSNGQLKIWPVIENGKVKELSLKKFTEKEKDFMKEMTEKAEKYPKDWQGKNAPDFVAKDLDDNKVSLSKLKGKVVVLKFWFIACKPCVEEMPMLNKMIENKYKDSKDVVFLAPCLDAKIKDINKLLDKHPFRYTSLYNAHDIAINYGIIAFPTHVVIDKDGIITYANLSSNGTTKSLEQAIDQALLGKKNEKQNKKRI